MMKGTYTELHNICHECLNPAERGRGKKQAGQSLDEAMEVLEGAFENVVDNDGLAHMAEPGIAPRRPDSAFHARTYGYPKLVDLIQAIPDVFEVEGRKELGPGAVYVRKKQA